MNIKLTKEHEQKAIGAAEAIAGIIIIGPADEAAVLVGTGGASLPLKPAQMGITAILGTLLVVDGFRRFTQVSTWPKSVPTRRRRFR